MFRLERTASSRADLRIENQNLKYPPVTTMHIETITNTSKGHRKENIKNKN